MKYFDKLSKITYDSNAVRDIFDRVQLETVSDSIVGYIDLDNYPDHRLYMLSNVLYGTIDYWWILAILNQKYDIIFDIPLSNSLMQTIASQEASASEISDKYDTLLDLNTATKFLKIIKPQYMNKVVLEIIRQLGN